MDASMPPPVGQTSPATSFAVVLVHGPAWDDTRSIREQDLWTEHAAFMDGLVTDGFLLIGGPLEDGSRTLHAVEAPDEAAVRAGFARDPWAASGHLLVGSVQPWALWLDFRTVRS